MCGIAGYVEFGGGRPDRALLESMAYALRRRGPDARGVLVDGFCGLAHARLSIIDVEGSPQPMQVGGADVSLVYNGELYNYVALRDELKGAGVSFATNGDTEVILRWVGREWEKALPRFNGMFGFGAWDRRRERLLLARDPIGEKPLFYALPREGMVVFGSEIKALLKVPGVEVELDKDALRQALRFRAVYGERTLYCGIRQVPPGCYLEFSREGGGVKTGRFYDLQAEIGRGREEWGSLGQEELIEAGRKLMEESVEERLVADVPVGAFLSGGLDSSLIVAVMQKLRGRPGGGGGKVRTFSVGFRGDGDSELPYAKIVAEAIGTEHTEVQVDEGIYLQRMVELTGCRDAPISEPADVAIAEMSGVARKSVKVVLSGEGADEVFAGYPKYGFAGAPWVLRRVVRMLGVERTGRLAGRVGLDRRRATVAARALGVKDELGRIVQWFSYLDRADLRGLLPGLGWSDEDWLATMESQSRALEQADHLSALGRMQLVDCLTWLPGNMLERGDRMTMAEGIEARPPFLNTRLVRYGLALPDRLKVRGRVGKWVVRRWAKELLPATIAGRKKWGFRVPLGQWFRGHLRGALREYLLDGAGLGGAFGDRGAIERLIAAHESGEVDANLTLWTLLAAEVWYRDVYLKGRRNDEQSQMNTNK